MSNTSRRPTWKIVSTRPPELYNSTPLVIWLRAGIIHSIDGVLFDQIPLSRMGQFPRFRGRNAYGEGTRVTASFDVDGGCSIACRPDITLNDFEWIPSSYA